MSMRAWAAGVWIALCALPLAGARAQGADPFALVPQADASDSGEAIGLQLAFARDQFDRRAGAAPASQHRIDADLRHEWTPAPGWKLGLSDRLEQIRSGAVDQTRNALRELYASRALGSAGFVDLGRIHWRNGVASGYNPSDFLKRGAAIAQTTQNPQTLRENRLGTVMLRAQAIAAGGSMQMALIPDLADRTSTAATAPAWDRTNGARAALVKLAPTLDERTSLDVLAYARADEHPQLGLNLTHLQGDAWVLHAEWAGRRKRALAGPGEAAPPVRWTNAIAAGATWTTPLGVVLTVELHYASDALTPARWRAWQAAMTTPLAAQLGALRSARAADQEPLTRDAWFARAAWDDAFGVRDVDLAALTRINATDHSRVWQTEAHWHLNDRHSASLVVGGYAGAANSEYGSLATRAYAQIAWAMYF